MKISCRRCRRYPAALLVLTLLCGMFAVAPFDASAQSRRQPPQSGGNRKKNQRPGQQPTQPGEPQPEPLPGDIVGTPQDGEVVEVKTTLVNVEAVVYEKKTGRIITGLKRANFAIFEDGTQKEITNFGTPEAPITVSLVLEYSRLTDALSGDRFEPGRFEVLRPMVAFLTQFIKPEDYVSVIAYDMRATPITDFTNDPRRINETINLLLRNRPAFSEANLFDAMKLALVGGRGDSVVLENSKARTAEYAGMAQLQGRRKAMILVTSGIDTFSRINYGQARKIAQNAGVPIHIIGTGELFFKRFSDRLEAQDSLGGFPGRLSMLQARNALNTFAKESGGSYYPMTFPSEVNGILQNINALMRSQYSLGYNPGDISDGKTRKLIVKVDVDGDGVYDEKQYVVKSRQFYTPPKVETGKS